MSPALALRCSLAVLALAAAPAQAQAPGAQETQNQEAQSQQIQSQQIQSQAPRVQPSPEAPGLRQELEELKRALLVRDQVIRNLARRIEALEAQLAAPDLALSPPAEAAAPTGQTAAAAPVEEDEAPGPEEAPVAEEVAEEVAAAARAERRAQDRLVRAAFEQTLIDRGGLLLPTWTLEVEPGLSYTHSSSDQIVIDGFTILPVLVVGDIVNERVRSDIVQGTLTTRLGLPWDLQVEARLPFGYQQRQVITAENEEARTDVFGLGDLELGVSHQILRAGGNWVPDLLASLRWKSTTGRDPFDTQAADSLVLGSGFHSLSGAVTAVRVVDPVVFFGGLSYTYNHPTEAAFGRFDPGDSIGAQAGLAIALNLDTSVSFAFDQQFSVASEVDGTDVPGSSLVTSTFAVGASYALSPDLTFDFAVRIGLSEDSPDVQLNLSLPLRFRF